ncbi:hypothetical protein DFH28DRAFT_1219665 [Melampsora americana]|nr:hypothetical protein DFH28DRAFT_1219665 [Melampsora americana]
MIKSFHLINMHPPSLNVKNCRIKKVFNHNVNNETISYSSGSERSPLESEFGDLSPDRLSLFNLEDPVPSPILERPLRIRSQIKKVCPPELSRRQLYGLLFQGQNRVLYTIKEEEEEGEIDKSKGKEKAWAQDRETLLSFVPKTCLKHHGFVVADGQDVKEALEVWVGHGDNSEITTGEGEEINANNDIHSSEYAKSFVEPFMLRNTW